MASISFFLMLWEQHLIRQYEMPRSLPSGTIWRPCGQFTVLLALHLLWPFNPQFQGAQEEALEEALEEDHHCPLKTKTQNLRNQLISKERTLQQPGILFASVQIMPG
jgi:hypothetical protein